MPYYGMGTKTMSARRREFVSQFSVFTANRMGRLHDLIALLDSHQIHVLALMVLDTTDTAIIRFVTDDPEKTRALLGHNQFSFTESELLAVEVDSATVLSGLMAALLEAEVNINYLYSFIPQPNGKSLLALSMEDNELAEHILESHQFKVLRQRDLSR